MAATRDWVGGQHNFFDPASWTPAGVPAAGDTATIGLGTAANPNTATVQNAILSGIQIVLDGGPGARGTLPVAEPTLSLTNAIIASDASIVALSEVNPNSSVTGSAENIAINGFTLNYGTIGTNTATNALNINLGNFTVLANLGGTISAGDLENLAITGAGYSALYNNGTVSGAGARIDVGTGVFGAGSFNLTDGAGVRTSGPPSGPIPSRLEFHQGVSSGQTISLTDSILILDAPMSFLGTINDLSIGPAANRLLQDPPNSSVELRDVTATGLAFQNDVLTVSNGSAVVAQLHFAPGLTSDDFTFFSGTDSSSGSSSTDIFISLPPGPASASATQMAQTAGLSVAPAQNST